MSLQTCLTDHLQTLQSLESLLHEENSLLLRHFEPDELAQITLRKYQTLEKVEQLDQWRAEILQGRNLGTQAQDLRAAVEEDHLQTELDQIFDLTEQLRSLGENNAILVDAFLAENQHALDALAAFSGRNNFYDASGKSQASNSTLSLKA